MEERELFGVTIGKETDDGLLSVSELSRAYEEASKLNDWSRLDISSMMRSSKLTTIFYDILKSDCNLKESYLEFNTEDKFRTIKVLKKYNLWVTRGKGKNRTTLCHKKIWKVLYVNLFGNYSSYQLPEWINEIPIEVHRHSITRKESKEQHFINKLLKDIDFFLNGKPIKQFVIDNYRYDLMFQIFDKKIIIEYNEKEHQYRTKEDLLKAKRAYDNGYYIVYIPATKEYDINKYISDIVIGNLTIHDLMWFCKIRFGESIDCLMELMNEDFEAHETRKYIESINKKVFLSGDLKLRVLADYHDIKYLAELERYIIESLESGLASTDKKLSSLIDNFIPSSMKTINI